MTRPPILDHAAQLAEPIRCRLLQLLDRHELTVGELCSVLQLPQSTVSRHLKVLGDAGWVAARRDGTSNLYRRDHRLNGTASELWGLIRSEMADTADSRQDRRRLDAVLHERRARSKEFFASSDEWDSLRDEFFGEGFDLHALPGLLDPDWCIGDLGCGTGRLSLALAPFVAEVAAVDASTAMLRAARLRLEGFESVNVLEGELEDLPIEDGRLDAATLVLTLHHLSEPSAALAEARRVLRPGGRLLVVDMLPHGHEDYRTSMGHVWLGFPLEQIETMLRTAGFESIRVTPLPADPQAKGPGLFAASGHTPRPNR
ncbi:MAG: metalloregulator ArsR/SmtB family transcription factor [Thermoanaerobaculia bacterium]|nr:metalloregulator ArsR/SmtB family transcription factor [Thermoanaerobaculia bacterium]